MEEKNTVCVPIETIQEFYELKGRVAAFAEWVKRNRYPVNGADCAAILGFELPDKEYE